MNQDDQDSTVNVPLIITLNLRNLLVLQLVQMPLILGFNFKTYDLGIEKSHVQF